MNDVDLRCAEEIWNYMSMGRKRVEVPRADLALVLGSHDLRVAEWAVRLYERRLVRLLLFSGGLGHLTRGVFEKSEADLFADVARRAGVDEADILVENRSTNTGENVRFSYEKLKASGIEYHSIILVQKPYMERRTYATFCRQWPGDVDELRFFVTSPPISFMEYPNDAVGSLRDVTSIMVGDLQRIMVYPSKGFQIPQEVPPSVQRAYEHLIKAGFTKHLISEN